jgi:hypothetical protein
MSKRDCGKWYCQRAAGFARLELGTDVRLSPVRRAADHDRKDLDRERAEIKAWMLAERLSGFEGWLAAYSHGNGAAKHYWVWDPDSREKYMEANGPWAPGEVPESYGDMHKGLGWQLPLLAVFEEEPSEEDLTPLRRNKVPYVVLGEAPPPPDPCEDCECECEVCEPCDCEPGECELQRGGSFRRRVLNRLDHIICLLGG